MQASLPVFFSSFFLSQTLMKILLPVLFSSISYLNSSSLYFSPFFFLLSHILFKILLPVHLPLPVFFSPFLLSPIAYSKNPPPHPSTSSPSSCPGLTNLQLSLYPSLAAFTVVSLCAIVFRHHLHKLAAESGMLSLLYSEICTGLAHVFFRLDVLFNDCKNEWEGKCNG